MLPPLEERRERVFLILAGIFLCAMTMLNIIGITRFVELGPMSLAVGVLPYPITFLVTDLISELYGRARANFLVWVGLGLNFFILGTLWLGQALPSVGPEAMPPWQQLKLAEGVFLPNGTTVDGTIEFYQLLFYCTSGAVFASMLAYIAAQFCDVQLFHFWKRVTKGKHLWVRNNFSTLISQLVDSFMVIAVTFGAAFLAGDMALATLFTLMVSNYLFKMAVALADTLPFYGLTHLLRKHLQFPNPELEYA
ncbi:MAG: queuosine precursor transporter [Pseudomonadales bacterium]|nr:queuosine precursor transporter [Pseudomonadales bacterium]